MKNWLLVPFLILCVNVFAQGNIKGIVQDVSGTLPGANISIEGTNTSTSAGYDGSFTLNSQTANGTIIVSYLGYKTKKVDYTVTTLQDLGVITLEAEENVLGEVVIKSTVIDVAKDRKTPVAVSTIKAAEIKDKLGNMEFPEVLATTPSVYATKGGGGFGDSRINIRGFDQRNVAVMINGVPVNDMENGAVFWSNWAGLSDVTTAMQVQRGLGSSKLAISSVGGTINVITRTSDAKKGGSFSGSLGNDDYLKVLGSYSTGKLENGLSASVLLSRTTGNGFVNGTKFEGHNYFIGLGYEINDKHDIQFTFTGAPQWHHQRSFANTIADYIKYGGGEPNIKYNSDWGYLKGEEFSWARNFYHKPVASLNYDWKISDKMKLSSVFYGSWGRGGGTGNIGRSPFSFKTASGLVPFNDFYAYNTGTYSSATREATTAIGSPSNLVPVGGQLVGSKTTGFIRRASINSHDWYGGVLNLNTKLTDKLTLDFGLDARKYVGYHFRNVSDLIGAQGYNAKTEFGTGGVWSANDINITQNPYILYNTYDSTPSWNPFENIKNQEKIDYNNNGYVRWYGAFTQLEYSTEKLSAFVQGAVSQQGFSREDLFQYKNGDPLQKTAYKNLLGGNVKGGVNYNFTDKMNAFVNAGYYSKQPFFNAVYPNNKSLVNENLTNEKILGLEAGYGFKSKYFNANLNGYYTSWKDRYQRSNDAAADNVGGYYDFAGIQQVHTGAELELTVRPIEKLSINGMASYGDWRYKNNITSNRYDVNNQQIGGGKPDTLFVNDAKVGDAAQMTASLGASFEIIKNLKLDATYRYADNLYANMDPATFKDEALAKLGTLKLPSYELLDAGLSFKINRVKDSKDYFNIRFNMNNVLDKVYIAESRTNLTIKNQSNFVFTSGPNIGQPNVAAYNTYVNNLKTYEGIDQNNQVFFGSGRTWNFTFSYNF